MPVGLCFVCWERKLQVIQSESMPVGFCLFVGKESYRRFTINAGYFLFVCLLGKKVRGDSQSLPVMFLFVCLSVCYERKLQVIHNQCQLVLFVS